MADHHYNVLFELAEEGGYVVTCPALPGLVTEGDTYEEAHECAIEAIEGYLESLQKDGLPFPPDKKLSPTPLIKAPSEATKSETRSISLRGQRWDSHDWRRFAYWQHL